MMYASIRFWNGRNLRSPSNLYYPARDRGFGPSLDRAGINLGDAVLFNVAAEFWPDIKQKTLHILGRRWSVRMNGV